MNLIIIIILEAFKGKVIWVTGASSGIGEFLAVEFAKNGAKVILSARSAVNLERVKQRCLGKKNHAIYFISILL